MSDLSILYQWLDKPELNECWGFTRFTDHNRIAEDLIRCLKATRSFKRRESWDRWTKVINDSSYSDLQRSLTLFEFFKRFATHARPIADFLKNKEVAPWFKGACYREYHSGPSPRGLDYHDSEMLTPVELRTPFMESVYCTLTFTINKPHPNPFQIESHNREFHSIFTTREQPCEYVFDQIGYSPWEYAQHFV